MQRFRPGISTLLTTRREWIEGLRVGLVTHPAAVDSNGASSTELLATAEDVSLAALFGPEHGFLGAATAGENVMTKKHPFLGIPVYSLYGTYRKPTPAMLKDIDVLVFDLQDMGARPYTYVSTLRLILEAAAASSKIVIVADRPLPLPLAIDGPMLDPAFSSFVAMVPLTMSYAMTPGETAMLLTSELGLDVDLRIARMTGYHRQQSRGQGWPPWIPPSPGIRSWESAQCYLATVPCEALPALDYGRGTGLPFQLLGSPWMKSRVVQERMADMHLPGVAFQSHPYVACTGSATGKILDGLRIVVTNPGVFRPVTTAISILSCIRDLYGTRKLWKAPGTRPDFFDKLFGTSLVRNALLDREPPGAIAMQWSSDVSRFARLRKQFLLYHPE